MRKLTSISVALIVAAGVMFAAPATAATTISNGVACTKLGAVKTVSGSKYKCAKNPMSTSSKRVWLTIDCLKSATAYSKALKRVAEVSSALAAQIPIIDLGIAKQIANKAEIQIKLDSTNLRLTTANAKLIAANAKLITANAKLAAAKAKLAAAISEANKKLLTTAVGSATTSVGFATTAVGLATTTVGSWTTAVRAYTSGINSITVNISKLEAAKLLATNQPAQLKVDVADTKANARLICTKGL